MQFSLVQHEDGSKNLTVFHQGQTFMAHSTHPNFEAIEAGVIAGNESVTELFDVAQAAADKLEPLSERISHANGRLFLDGVEIHDALADQIIAFLRQGVPNWMPLVAFFENVLANPNEHSREQLYRWLVALGQDNGLTITEDGLIVGYKGVQADGDGFKSINSGTAFVNGVKQEGRIKQNIGDVITMPRNEVVHDPSLGCHEGLHVGTFSYARGFSRGAVLEVHVNPRDVVSVPTDTSDQKMRCCRYTVVNTIQTPYTEAIVYSEVVDDPDDYLDPELDDCGCGSSDCCGDPGCCCDDGGLDMPDDDELFIDSGTPATKDGVTVGDRYQAVDSRRSGVLFKVESIEGDFAVGKSMPRNLTRKVRLDRLTSRKYRKV